MSKLVIGVRYEDGLTWSIAVTTDNSQNIANALAKHNDNGMPDEILVVVNGDDCPDVEKHLSFGRNYY